MTIKQADFVASYPKASMCPQDGRAEFAFIGRSNVGKSSLLNMLTGRRQLAKVSGTPGKTRLLNYFLVNQQWYLVDLPGYGYARLNKSEQQTLSKMIQGYLEKRLTLAVAFVLIDANLEPTKIDLAFIQQLGEMGVPFALVFTKTDRLTPTALQRNVDRFMTTLSETWETLPPHFITSSERPRGREEILGYIGEVLRELKKSKSE